MEELLSTLIEDDYLNEERFARQFAGGKFRMKSWGRVKIRYELKQKQVSEYCIQKGLKEISEDDYLMAVRKLAESKKEQLPAGLQGYMKKAKIVSYLLHKGYELDVSSNAAAAALESNI